MNKKSEKKRCSNFSSYEINLLKTLVSERQDILKSPKLDSATVEKRNMAWREITTIFNNDSSVNVFRTETKLKKKYSNLRCEWNKAVKVLKLEESPTGDDEIEQANDNAVANIVCEKEADEKCCINESIENKDEIMESNATEESTKQQQESAAQDSSVSECSDYCSSHGDEDLNINIDLPQINVSQFENQTQLSTSLAAEKSKLEIEIMATEHCERMKLMKMKHHIEMQRIELQRQKYHLELELLSVEIAVKRKKLVNRSQNKAT